MTLAAPSPDRDSYVRRLLELYRRAPGTIGHVRPADRRLAATLWQRGITLDLVETAMLLAAARRADRPEHQTVLPPVRSLHYFLPVIDELLAAPPPPGYKQYLADRASTPDGVDDGACTDSTRKGGLDTQHRSEAD